MFKSHMGKAIACRGTGITLEISSLTPTVSSSHMLSGLLAYTKNTTKTILQI